MAAQRSNFKSYLSSHKAEIIDWINGNVKTLFTPTGEIFDRLVNQATEEYPYGRTPGPDNMHRFLTNAIMCSLWCGWFSQARTNANDPNFTPEYIERFKDIITQAYEMGKDLAPDKS